MRWTFFVLIGAMKKGATQPPATSSTESVSTLARILRQRGCTRRELRNAEPRSFRKWQRDHLNELWQSDMMQGLYLSDPADSRRKKATHLIAFLDDCSRLVPHA